MPYGPFNSSLVEKFICWDTGIQQKIKLNKESQAANQLFVLHLPDVSGIAGTRTLIGLQLSLWSIYFHISSIYSEACGLPNLSELWASLELKFKYGKLLGCDSK